MKKKNEEVSEDGKNKKKSEKERVKLSSLNPQRHFIEKFRGKKSMSFQLL